MKLFTTLLLVICLMPVSALASGKISVEPSYSLKSEKFGGQAGVSIYEPLFLGLNYNQWTGGGVKPHVFSDNVAWFASKHSLDMWIGNFGFGPGYKFELNNAEADVETGVEHSVFFKVTYQLW